MSNASSSTLFKPVRVGSLQLQHRIVLAPLTRMRNVGYTPTKPIQPEYYEQRTTPGALLINEATAISPQASAEASVPGIWSDEQVQGWRRVTDAVHARGGYLFCQLWHMGRQAGAAKWQWQGKDYDLVSASATRAKPNADEARPLSSQEVEALPDVYAHAARQAMRAGFDGVELHGANGYLLDQFLQPITNLRDDAWGGSDEGRRRLPLEVTRAVAEAVGEEKVGYRISPFGRFGGMGSDDPNAIFVPFVRELLAAHPRLAYIHAVEARIDGSSDKAAGTFSGDLSAVRDVVVSHRGGVHAEGTQFIAAGGHTPASASQQSDEHGDLVAFGRLFISNPDLVNRVRRGLPLSHYDRSTFYGGDAKGYTDYPVFEAQQQQAKV